MGTWSKQIDFSMIPVNEYKAILGMDFLDHAKTLSMLIANDIFIIEGNKACMLPMIPNTKRSKKVVGASGQGSRPKGRGIRTM